MPIVNAQENGGMRDVSHLMDHVAFRYAQSGIVITFDPSNPAMHESLVREIYFKNYDGEWIKPDGKTVSQGNKGGSIVGETRFYTREFLDRMSLKGLQATATEIGAPIHKNIDSQIQAILDQQAKNAASTDELGEAAGSVDEDDEGPVG
jgi:hypothetical protein